jgi:mannose/cellobiose epimerase-like protein (N-acyl-D-glucosamine 2-epimerase family)
MSTLETGREYDVLRGIRRSPGSLSRFCRIAVALLMVQWGAVLRADDTVPRPVAQRAMATVDLDKVLKDLPDGDRWIHHVREDLMPFWTTEAALGNPPGNFPTYRANDGSLVDPEHLPPEFAHADPSIFKIDRDYVRSKSRQTYAYGVAYHMTGEENFLFFAKAGADWLITNALDKDEGGAYTWFRRTDRTPGPSVKERTSQDLAYAATGIAFLYYLTRDKKYLDPVIDLKKFIWKEYLDKETGILRWVNEPNDDHDRVTQKELVSQLDQVYGYLLWTTLALPEGELRKEWERDLISLARTMRNQFFSDRLGLYWGQMENTQKKNLGADHTDFGHSIKTLWLTYRVGLTIGDQALVEFAKPRISELIDRAYLPETGSWARGYKKDLTGSRWVLDHDKEWWSLCELDQTTATMALVDPAYAAILPRTYDYWFRYMVDHQHGDVWHMVFAVGNVPDLTIPKVHSWKNAFHVHEHALVSYLTTQQLLGKPAKLHYAFKDWPSPASVHPYMFLGHFEPGNMRYGEPFAKTGLKHYKAVAISFTGIR